MSSGGKASGRGRGHDWSRRWDECNGDDEPPVSCSDWQGWQKGWSVSHRNWESGNTWQHNPTSGSDWQSSDRWQRSQPAVAAAVDTCTSVVQPADRNLHEELKNEVVSIVQEAVASAQQNDTRGTAAAKKKKKLWWCAKSCTALGDVGSDDERSGGNLLGSGSE